MKIFKMAVASLLLVGTVFTSCTKDPTLPSPISSDNNNENAAIRVVEYDGANGPSKILSFKDMETFQNTEESLEKAFGEKGVSVLQEFVKSRGLQSHLNDYIVTENAWLQKQELTVKESPTTLFNNFDELHLALYNKSYAIMIGGVIHIEGQEQIVTILNGNLSELSNIENSISSKTIETENIKVLSTLNENGNPTGGLQIAAPDDDLNSKSGSWRLTGSHRLYTYPSLEGHGNVSYTYKIKANSKTYKYNNGWVRTDVSYIRVQERFVMSNGSTYGGDDDDFDDDDVFDTAYQSGYSRPYYSSYFTLSSWYTKHYCVLYDGRTIFIRFNG